MGEIMKAIAKGYINYKNHKKKAMKQGAEK